MTYVNYISGTRKRDVKMYKRRDRKIKMTRNTRRFDI